MALKKSFGQHFLKDKRVVSKIAAALDLTDFEVVVEVGPGAGAVTDALVEKVDGQQLILIEADRDLLPNLSEKYPLAKIINEDATKVDFCSLVNNKKWLFISNLPYNAAAAILMNALTCDCPPQKLVIMVQKEQADRMQAKPGEMSVLSVATQLYTKTKRLFNVKPGAFNPPPKVDSSVLALSYLEGDIDREEVIKLAKVGFSSRRKQLHRNLSDANMADSGTVKKVLIDIGLKETARAQELSPDQWKQLWKVLHKTG